MPGLVPGIHGVPLQRTSLLNSRLFPQPVNLRRCHYRESLKFLRVDQKTRPLDALDPLGSRGGKDRASAVGHIRRKR
jgi:hypothetical protein